MINSIVPDSWQDLQNDVAQILNECGMVAETDKTINTIRGSVAIDVLVTDSSQTPLIIGLCECKHWNSNVPKREIHAFCTVVNDYGANWGMVISKKGYQKGAYDAAQHTNLKLLNWIEFQSLFAERWYRGYLLPTLNEKANPFLEYSDPINSRIDNAIELLSDKKQKHLDTLIKKYLMLHIFTGKFCHQLYGIDFSIPELPICNYIKETVAEGYGKTPDDILRETSLRGLLDAFLRNTDKATAEYDEVFGKRI